MVKKSKNPIDIGSTADVKQSVKPVENETLPNPPGNEVSPFIEAFQMLSHITTAIALMLICGGGGYAIDQYFEMKGVSLIGFLAGGTFAVRHLMRATSPPSSGKK